METGGEVSDPARELADVDAIRRRVINVVGHVLRTPVTTMAGMANALEHAQDEETRALLVDGLVRNGRRVEELLDELLIAAGVATAVPTGEPSAVSVHDVVRATMASLGSLTELELDGDDAEVVARPEVLGRIVHEMLDNGLKYGHGRVLVRAVRAPSLVEIDVESTGDVPTDEELEHAFELLYRGEHAVTTTPGLGIGLPVARSLAHAEGADVTLERRGETMVATVRFRT